MEAWNNVAAVSLDADMSDVTVTDNSGASRYEALVDGEVAGFAEYRRTDDHVAFTHTVVEPAYAGRGLGSALAKTALDEARDAGLAVLPFCPFFRTWIERHPDYVALVPEDRRAEFGL